MGLIARPVAGKKKSELICEAFIVGAPKDAEGEVFYGVDQSNARHWNRVQRQGTPYFYCDNSYFDSVRGAQFRVTKNRMQLGDVLQRTSDGKRFGGLGPEIKPMQHNVDGHFLIIEQSPSFMHLVGEPDWLSKTVRWVEGTGRRAIVRPWLRNKAEAQATLRTDLQGAWGLVTHTSAAAVTALLEGVPSTVGYGHALAYVRGHADNSRDQRRHAFNVLADHQFTLDEMKEGMAWAKVGS